MVQVKTFPLPVDTTKYVWNKMNTFARWYKSSNHTAVIFFRQGVVPLKEEFQSTLFQPAPTKGELADPFWIYPRLAEVISGLESDSVWGTRTMIRNLEKERDSERSVVEPKYSELHDISRHVVHVSETLKVAALTLESIRKHHEEFFQTHPAKSNIPVEDLAARMSVEGLGPKMPLESRKIRKRLAFSHHMLQCNLQRSEANYARIQGEITLTFNKVSQKDSNASVQIALQTNKDSKIMKVIAFITMLFLPSTFTSAIFSTSFFKFDQGSWEVSPKIWIFFAFAAAATCIAALVAWWLGLFDLDKSDPSAKHQKKAKNGVVFWKPAARSKNMSAMPTQKSGSQVVVNGSANQQANQDAGRGADPGRGPDLEMGQK
jgi:hypothetical protein